MKFVLLLHVCSFLNTATPICTATHVVPLEFNSHYDCVNAGYSIAQKTFRDLKKLEDWDKPDFEKQKIVVRFECKEIKVNA